MIGFYNYTVILTYIGTLFGFTGIISIYNDNLKMSLICLLLAGFCDMFDGKIASTMERTTQEKKFGIQIDSLSDLICFGLLPALIGLHCSTKHIIPIFISATYLLCALIRLAWFNVDEEERQDQNDGIREKYLGLPVTSSALIIPFTVGIGHFLGLTITIFLPFVVLLTAVAFLTPFQLKKPQRVGKIAMVMLGSLILFIVIKRRGL